MTVCIKAGLEDIIDRIAPLFDGCNPSSFHSLSMQYAETAMSEAVTGPGSCRAFR